MKNKEIERLSNRLAFFKECRKQGARYVESTGADRPLNVDKEIERLTREIADIRG